MYFDWWQSFDLFFLTVSSRVQRVVQLTATENVAGTFLALCMTCLLLSVRICNASVTLPVMLYIVQVSQVKTKTQTVNCVLTSEQWAGEKQGMVPQLSRQERKDCWGLKSECGFILRSGTCKSSATRHVAQPIREGRGLKMLYCHCAKHNQISERHSGGTGNWTGLSPVPFTHVDWCIC